MVWFGLNCFCVWCKVIFMILIDFVNCFWLWRSWVRFCFNFFMLSLVGRGFFEKVSLMFLWYIVLVFLRLFVFWCVFVLNDLCSIWSNRCWFFLVDFVVLMRSVWSVLKLFCLISICVKFICVWRCLFELCRGFVL